ncbi:hypothetical protein [Aminobacter aminovorans]|uniref:Uncharacterized protein n=1 Tax=Aminobacter aminovorans TaxID=83263 RepID=A0AAC8YN72_AMIAI|nr:hypothetical protein [Aminobacter aminovorans]AMS41201.1 hypothetical protein AA2016_2273 [Aminobacter aminovorans]MBB3705816.1 hypothetical protein [Aminobacter aminovorans]
MIAAAVAIPLGADEANDTLDALMQAEAFVAGFEGDRTQEGVADILAGLRLAINREQAAPAMLAALKLAEACLSGTLLARGYAPGSCTDEWAAEVRLEVRTLADVRAAVAQAEGR